jgi:hypothetical protein
MLLGALAAAVAVTVTGWYGSTNWWLQAVSSRTTSTRVVTSDVGQWQRLLAEGRVLNVDYSHCRNENLHDGSSSNKSNRATMPSTPTIDIVLLHGTKYRRVHWHDVMIRLCSSSSAAVAHAQVAVTAYDLSVDATYNTLLNLLRASANATVHLYPTNEYHNDSTSSSTFINSSASTTRTLLSDLPIAALVTPSASGSIVLDGLTSGHAAELQRAIQRWIPVASNAVLDYSVKELAPALADWSVTAIYGDLDRNGRRSSERLQRAAAGRAKAKAVQLPGQHAVYLDAPDAFVKTILQNVANNVRTKD